MGFRLGAPAGQRGWRAFLFQAWGRISVYCNPMHLLGKPRAKTYANLGLDLDFVGIPENACNKLRCAPGVVRRSKVSAQSDLQLGEICRPGP